MDAVSELPHGQLGFDPCADGSLFGADCHDLTILATGPFGSVTFGSGSTVRGRVCGPQRNLRFGTGTTLQGRFLGQLVNGGRDTVATCCP